LRFFDSKIEFLKGVGPEKAALLNTELGVFSFGDLLEHFPFRYEDRSKFILIKDITEDLTAVQIIVKIIRKESLGEGPKKRLKITVADSSGMAELLWFQGMDYANRTINEGGQYIVYGKPLIFNGLFSISHPEVEIYSPDKTQRSFFQPIYPFTEKLRKKFLDSRSFTNWFRNLIPGSESHFNESLPEYLIQKYRLISRFHTYLYLHLPENYEQVLKAHRRLKYEELFFNQLRLISLGLLRKTDHIGQIFSKTQLLTEFYKIHLPFDLTGAQKRVIHQVFSDMKTGKQMNRLVQGDVGSGKTIVAFICMLLAIDNGAQACMMAPTEILAQQHYAGLKKFSDLLGFEIALLTGSTKKKDREPIHLGLLNGKIKIIVGTHALLEDVVQFQNLGLAVIDEQHRFGVAQRAKLWAKNKRFHPHILVMTATPIPRTLAMTLYGDLDVSEIDELPPGRKAIETKHRYDSHRLTVFQFMRDEIAKGHQVYVVYPLIEESEKFDLKDLMDGYFSITRAFPDCAVSIVHGKQKPKEKESEMTRFKKQETQIMVATTVIEVGVDVPNASVMVIENAERFGLSQLHQLRGRVGRGAEQSYCILMTSYKISADSKKRLDTMVSTQNGFEIAKVDLELRGPGDMAGTAQSGIVDLKIADLAKDEEILKIAREDAMQIIQNDPLFNLPQHIPIKNHLNNVKNKDQSWSRIS
jgi:ATP-dependent DNA helicase RecG